MIVKEIEAKSILVKSNLPESDFVINPYTGCSHSCLYCYARFMKRFTGHTEMWGDFVDAKINSPDLIPKNTEKFKNKSIVIGSVTDAYQPWEGKYQLIRQIIQKLIALQPNLDIITKSRLVLRDIDLLKQFDNCTVAMSASFLDEKAKNKLEPQSIPTKKRLDALKEIHKAGLKTVLFISPIFPEISDWKKLIELTQDFANQYWFENLNLYPSIRSEIYKFLKAYNPDLISKYKEIYSPNSHYWDRIEDEIQNYCNQNKLNYRIYFHHKSK
jgi:DNA repair photolyase